MNNGEEDQDNQGTRDDRDIDTNGLVIIGPIAMDLCIILAINSQDIAPMAERHILCKKISTFIHWLINLVFPKENFLTTIQD